MLPSKNKSKFRFKAAPFQTISDYACAHGRLSATTLDLFCHVVKETSASSQITNTLNPWVLVNSLTPQSTYHVDF